MGRALKDYDEEYVGNLTLGGVVLRFLLGVIAFAIVGTVVFGLLGLGLGWFNAGKDIISPANVKSQYQFAYDNNEALKGIAQNVCTAEEAWKQTTDPASKDERLSQLIAQKNLYQLRERSYDAQLENAFKAKYVKPADVPNQAPTLAQERAAIGC